MSYSVGFFIAGIIFLTIGAGLWFASFPVMRRLKIPKGPWSIFIRTLVGMLAFALGLVGIVFMIMGLGQ